MGSQHFRRTFTANPYYEEISASPGGGFREETEGTAPPPPYFVFAKRLGNQRNQPV